MSIFEPQTDYTRHDTFLFALLGIAHANETLLRLLASGRANTPASLGIDHTSYDGEHQQFVSALLGLISLAEQSQRIIDAWANVDVEPPNIVDPAGLGFDALADLMR